eukprot:m.100510 g.100510  ORF g.100510 m.100510 type:complete len:98 (-) comp15129_c0_seq5:173-466(-)
MSMDLAMMNESAIFRSEALDEAIVRQQQRKDLLSALSKDATDFLGSVQTMIVSGLSMSQVLVAMLWTQLQRWGKMVNSLQAAHTVSIVLYLQVPPSW